MKLLGIVFVAALSVAAADSPPANKPNRTIASGDTFVQAEQMSQSWLEFPGKVVRGWQLSLRLSTNTYTIGGPVSVVVVFKNAWTNSMRMRVSTPAIPYMVTLSVLDAAGHNVPVNDEARERMEHGHASFAIFRDVAPGDKLAFPVEMQNLYGPGQPGHYILQATARWLPGNAHGDPGSAENTAPVTTGLAPFVFIAAPPSNMGRPDPPQAPAKP
jgi:hypothetical protein